MELKTTIKEMPLTEAQARHMLEPLLEGSPTQLQALVRRTLLVPSGRHASRTSSREIVANAVSSQSSPVGAILEALLPDAIFRAAVLDLGWPVHEGALLYRAACAIVG
jgi:hypothetical protein